MTAGPGGPWERGPREPEGVSGAEICSERASSPASVIEPITHYCSSVRFRAGGGAGVGESFKLNIGALTRGQTLGPGQETFSGKLLERPDWPKGCKKDSSTLRATSFPRLGPEG